MKTALKLRTKEPEWIRISEAAWKIDPNWSCEDLYKYILDNEYATIDQLYKQKTIPFVIQTRPDYLITDYSWDLFEIADSFIVHVINERIANKF